MRVRARRGWAGAEFRIKDGLQCHDVLTEALQVEVRVAEGQNTEARRRISPVLLHLRVGPRFHIRRIGTV